MGCFRRQSRAPQRGEIAVVTAEHPTDPFRPQVKILTDKKVCWSRTLLQTLERDQGAASVRGCRGGDPESTDIDP